MSDKFDPLTGNILPTFFRYALPAVFGMLAISSAAMVDGIFLGNYVGANALAAVNISLPVLSFLYAIVWMLAIGGSVMSGKFLGAGNNAEASDVFSLTLISVLLASAFFCLSALGFIDSLIANLGAGDELQQPVNDYLSVILIFAPLFSLGYTLFYFVQLDGKPYWASAALILCSLLNVLLDALFIVVFDQGISGAAWATGLSQAAILLFLLPYLFPRRFNIKSSMYFQWPKQWKKLFPVVANGFSEFTNELSGGIVILLLNWIMITRLGVEGVAAITIVNYMLLVGLMIAYGIGESLQPIVSQCLGAKLPQRIKQYLMLALACCLTVGVVLSALLLFAPVTITELFLKADEQTTMQLALQIILLFWPAFLFSGMNITLSSYFTAMHKPLHSVFIALLRSLLLPVICLLSLPLWLGDTGVYISIPIAEGLTFIVAVTLAYLNRPEKIIRLTV